MVHDTPDIVLHSGVFTTLDRSNPTANAVAIKDGVFTAVGRREDIVPLADASTRIIDLKGRRVLPGLIDNHLHIIRGGLTFNMELRWDGVRSLADGMAMLKRQVAVTPPPQWIRIVGGFTAHQFAEKRLPTIEELNAVAPDTPVFLLHLYDRAILNAAALRVVGYTKDTPDPPAGEIVRDARGNPTGLILAKPNAWILYATLDKGPKLPFEYQLNSTRHFMRELKSARNNGRDRCRRRLSVLSARFPSHPEAERSGTAHDPARLQSLHAEAEGGERGFSQLDEISEIQARGRLLPPQWRRRDAGAVGRGLRRLPPAPSRPGPGNGRRARGGRAHSRREPVAMAYAFDL